MLRFDSILPVRIFQTTCNNILFSMWKQYETRTRVWSWQWCWNDLYFLFLGYLVNLMCCQYNQLTLFVLSTFGLIYWLLEKKNRYHKQLLTNKYGILELNCRFSFSSKIWLIHSFLKLYRPRSQLCYLHRSHNSSQ